MTGRIKRTFLTVLKHTLNPLTLRAARSGRGPFSLVRHVGRRSGTVYETPLILARVPQGFIAELTYGPQVSWYRNIVAAGGCVILFRGQEYTVDRIEPFPAEAGIRAFGFPASAVLRLLRRREFRMLHLADPARDQDGGMSNPAPDEAESMASASDTSSLESTLDDVAVDDDRAAAETHGFEHDEPDDAPPAPN